MIKLTNVSTGYAQPVLSKLSFEIAPASVTAVIGANGSGKSTLAQVLAGLKRDFKGEIAIDDMPLTRRTPVRKLRQKVGLVLQHPEHQLVFDRLDTELNFGRENLGLSLSKDLLMDTLAKVGLDLPLETNPWQLSGGQQQRLAIASQLMLEPSYLLLDEATTMLDYPGRQLVYDTIAKLARDGLGVILFTNQLEEILLAERVILLSQGTATVHTKSTLLSHLNILSQHGLAAPPLLQLAAKHQLKTFAELAAWLNQEAPHAERS